jgi:hypothetical protein
MYSRDDTNLGSNTQAARANAVMQDLINFQTGGLSGAYLLDAIALMPNAGALAGAFCVVTVSGASGTWGLDINGVALTATAGGGDQASTDLLVAAINASTNALVQGIAKAGYDGYAKVVCASVAAGDTVTLSGITLTAVAGTRAFRQFSKDTNDTDTGLDLCAAINTDPVLGHFWAASNSSGTVSIYPRFPTATAPIGLGGVILSSSNVTRLATTALTADPSFAVCAVLPGVQGNSISLIANGTGATLVGAATPTVNYASGNRLLANGGGANTAAATRYYGRLP